MGKHNHHLIGKPVILLFCILIATSLGWSRHRRIIHGGWRIDYIPVENLPSWVIADDSSFTVFADFDHLPPHDSKSDQPSRIAVYYVNNTDESRYVSQRNLQAATGPGKWERVTPEMQSQVTVEFSFPNRIVVPLGYYFIDTLQYYNSGTPRKVRYYIKWGKDSLTVSNIGQENIPDSLIMYARFDDYALADSSEKFLRGILTGAVILPPVPSHLNASFFSEDYRRSPYVPAAQELARRFRGDSTAAFFRSIMADTSLELSHRELAAQYAMEMGRKLAEPILKNILLTERLPDDDRIKFFHPLVRYPYASASTIIETFKKTDSQRLTVALWGELADFLNSDWDARRDTALAKLIVQHRYDLNSKALRWIVNCNEYIHSPDLGLYLKSIWLNDTLPKDVHEAAEYGLRHDVSNPNFKSSLIIVDSANRSDGEVHLRWAITNTSLTSLSIDADSLRVDLKPRLVIQKLKRYTQIDSFSIDSPFPSGIVSVAPGKSYDVRLTMYAGTKLDSAFDPVIHTQGSTWCVPPCEYPFPTEVVDGNKDQILRPREGKSANVLFPAPLFFVTNTTPARGENLFPTEVVSVGFSEPIDAASILAEFRIVPKAPGQVVAHTGETHVQFIADTGYTPGVRYEVRISPTLRSEYGHTLDSAFTLGFEVDSLLVTKVEFGEGIKGASSTVGTIVSTNFEVDAKSVPGAITISPKVALRSRSLANTFAFTPKKTYKRNTKYTVTISRRLMSAGKSHLSAPYTFSFTTGN
jgi:hypothetical protein